MPWGWGELTIDEDNPRSGPYHLVWPRDLYQVATALHAAGDTDGANRALDFAFDKQQLEDGSFPQNTQVDGRPKWTSTQMDQVGLPIVLAWQLNRARPKDWRHVRAAADFIVEHGPKSEQERWENQEGYSPATIAAEIAGLICAADIARRNGDTRRAATYERTADSWQRNVQRWTATTNGPYAPKPYYLRITKDRKPDKGTTYAIGDSGPSKMDQRRVVDVSFLELVRLGVKRPDDPAIVNTLRVVDQRLGAGSFWHRFSFDGYGERRDGKAWRLFDDDTRRTLGRAWPIFAGERGEYELLAGRPAAAQLEAMASAANGGGMLPEQVWDGREPTGEQGFRLGAGTFSATPLAWTHAQLVRLAWSAEAGAPVERPGLVAERYMKEIREAILHSDRSSGRSPLGAAARYPSLPTSRRCGVFFAARRIHEPTTLGARLHGPRRRPDRCDPRMRGLQAPELSDKEVQAQQPGSHHAAQVLQVVPASYRAPRDALGPARWPPIVQRREESDAEDLGDDRVRDDDFERDFGQAEPPDPLGQAEPAVTEAHIAEAGALTGLADDEPRNRQRPPAPLARRARGAPSRPRPPVAPATRSSSPRRSQRRAQARRESTITPTSRRIPARACSAARRTSCAPPTPSCAASSGRIGARWVRARRSPSGS